MAEEKGLSVGVYLTTKKLNEPHWKSVVDLATKENIKFTNLDLERPVSDQGQFDLIICKLNSDISLTNSGGVTRTMANIEEYSQNNPSVPFIDSVAAQKSLMCRLSMDKIFNTVCEQLSDELTPVNSIYLDDESSVDKLVNFPFPGIAKTAEAGGSHQSHQMGVVFNKDNLKAFKKPVLLQQFHNHNAVIYKVYVTMPEVSVDVRPSLPNFFAEEGKEPLMFNSQKFSDLYGQKEEVKPPTPELLKKVANVVAESSGLTLFGFDLIYCVNVQKYTIIDINFFPGYLGITAFPQHLINLIKSKVQG